MAQNAIKNPQGGRLSMEDQQQDQWCWAAVAVSVAAFYSTQGGPSGQWQQCELVTALSSNLVGHQENCCPPGAAPDCNKSSDLTTALTQVAHSGGDPTTGVCDYDYLQGQIDGNCPVGVRIGWDGGTAQGHFILLTSYNDNGQMVHVEDPQFGPSDLPFDSLRSTVYHSSGRWTHTFPIV